MEGSPTEELCKIIEKLMEEHGYEEVLNITRQVYEGSPAGENEARIKREGCTISQASREQGIPVPHYGIGQKRG